VLESVRRWRLGRPPRSYNPAVQPNTVTAGFLEFSRWKLLEQYWPRLRACVESLNDEQVWWRPNEASNSIGNLILHLNGNVQQWILGGIGGAPDARVRDEEFSARGGMESGRLGRLLRESVDRAAALLIALPPARLAERTTIQGHDVTLLEAIFHVVEHFSGHTSQIIFITKMLTGEDLGFYSYLSKAQLHAGKTA